MASQVKVEKPIRAEKMENSFQVWASFYIFSLFYFNRIEKDKKNGKAEGQKSEREGEHEMKCKLIEASWSFSI